MTDWKHYGQRIEEHNGSKAHKDCAEAYMLQACKADIRSLLAGNQMSAHREQLRKRRQVLERIVDIVKIIGKRGLSYRHLKNQAAYTLEDTTLDHGNFLEIILLLGKYDVILKEHLSKCIEQSKQLHQSGAKSRGSLVTFMSKTTVNSVTDTVKLLIQESIFSEIQEAGMFSVQIDTTQDITSQDQCSVILRYETDVVNERLIALVKCEKSTGQHFVNLLTEVMDKLKLDMTWGLMYKGCLSTKKWCTHFFTSTIRCIKSEMNVEMCGASRKFQGCRTHFSTAIDSLATLRGDVGKLLE